MRAKPLCKVADHEKARFSSIGEAVFEKTANLFHAIGDVGRLRLLERLLRKEWCVTELAEALGEEISTVSQRLKLLRAHGIVSRRREGKHIFYILSDQHIINLISDAITHASEPKSNFQTRKIRR